ncbi:MAG: hypothetical protein MZV64_16730 [Ignavibacteriales bacterium]|nr:hypothetical protein [Ignavibacteriales bacterium]
MGTTYASAGVNIDEGDRFVQLIKKEVRTTFNPGYCRISGPSAHFSTGDSGECALPFSSLALMVSGRSSSLPRKADGTGRWERTWSITASTTSSPVARVPSFPRLFRDREAEGRGGGPGDFRLLPVPAGKRVCSGGR